MPKSKKNLKIRRLNNKQSRNVGGQVGTPPGSPGQIAISPISQQGSPNELDLDSPVFNIPGSPLVNPDSGFTDVPSETGVALNLESAFADVDDTLSGVEEDASTSNAVPGQPNPNAVSFGSLLNESNGSIGGKKKTKQTKKTRKTKKLRKTRKTRKTRKSRKSRK